MYVKTVLKTMTAEGWNFCLLLTLMQTFFKMATTNLRSYLGLTPGYQPAGFPRKDLGHGRQKVVEISMTVEMLSPVVCLIFKIITIL